MLITGKPVAKRTSTPRVERYLPTNCYVHFSGLTPANSEPLHFVHSQAWPLQTVGLCTTTQYHGYDLVLPGAAASYSRISPLRQSLDCVELFPARCLRFLPCSRLQHLCLSKFSGTKVNLCVDYLNEFTMCSNNG